MVFEQILNWKLLEGSHSFPGPDGGTCLMEAAIVASGFDYRPVHSEAECPLNFSPVIARYGIGLNDVMPDGVRQKLLTPFVMRMARTADRPEKEVERAQFIAIQTMKRILPILFHAIGLPDCAFVCQAVEDSTSAFAAAQQLAKQVSSKRAELAACYGLDPAIIRDVKIVGLAAAEAFDAAARSPRGATRNALVAVAICSTGVSSAADREEICRVATAIFGDAINLGNHDAPLQTSLVVSRMETTKQRAAALAA